MSPAQPTCHHHARGTRIARISVISSAYWLMGSGGLAKLKLAASLSALPSSGNHDVNLNISGHEREKQTVHAMIICGMKISQMQCLYA